MPKPPLNMNQLRRIARTANALKRARAAGFIGATAGVGGVLFAGGSQDKFGPPPELSPERQKATRVFTAVGGAAAIGGYAAHRARRALLKFANRRARGL